MDRRRRVEPVHDSLSAESVAEAESLGPCVSIFPNAMMVDSSLHFHRRLGLLLLSLSHRLPFFPPLSLSLSRSLSLSLSRRSRSSRPLRGTDEEAGGADDDDDVKAIELREPAG